MLVPMLQVEVLAQRRALDDVLTALQRLRTVEVVPGLADAADEPGDAAEHGSAVDAADEVPLEALLARLDRLLALVPPTDDLAPTPLTTTAVEQLLERAEAVVADPLAALEQLRAESDRLPRTVTSLEALVPLVPELAELSDEELATLSLATIAVVLDAADTELVEQVRTQLEELLGRRHLLVTAPVEDAVGCLLVLPARDVTAAEGVLGSDRIAQSSVPPEYAGRSLSSTVAAMRTRLALLPHEVDEQRRTLEAALAPYVPTLAGARAGLAATLERQVAARHAERDRRTAALRLWVPRHRLDDVKQTLSGLPVPVVVTDVRSRDRRGTAPVLLRNWLVFRPFERLVGFLSWPTPHGVDPTGLMAVVLPLLFGIMVGDIGYGVLLLGIALLVRRRWAASSAVAGDVSRVLAAGAWWSIVFGVLYGELFGDLGKALWGLPALWFYRGGPDALTPLLLFVIAVGLAHIVLGLLLGLWLAVRERHVGHALERGGTLLVLMGLFAVAGGALAVLPSAALPPGVAAVVVGLVLSSVVHGKLGVLLGPLELVGTLGGILSYLRLAAVGLASVYLAIVANELARQAPLVLGVVVAVFFHALNLALAAFSPMVQSLRLHYVEFFGRFYDGGGRLFAPLGAGLAEPAPARPVLPEPRDVVPAGPSPAPVPAHR